ncbi:HAMP domain-containing histidine kinase [Paraconexibacter antarcticus]|uniref:histidine kinase n=1 Tax=Paraconexibacter antarcticus TaxID=2949664 RepID=A0ABY5DYU8_9ACTN|nr:HAMP domain-containing sensor histidine kinase [Paraconexibacter antarcticus]UTI66119.1 HAMP domain-containing histidine kinase [Paraconexibacter antarcticus]
MLRGLRGRLVGALVLGSAVTLAVAAVLLLSPLESRLLQDGTDTLVAAVGAQRATLEQLPLSDVRGGGAALLPAARELRRQTGAEITILTLRGKVVAATDPDDSAERRVPPAALRTRSTTGTVVGSGPTVMARVLLPVHIGGMRLVVVAERRLNDVRDAASVVKRAFLKAAVISLAIALLLGLLLAGRLVRRLRALRDTALRVAELGPVVEMRADTTRDEVGDLTRALATMQDHLREEEQARRSFVATASHELRTPLSSLRLMLDLLRDDLHSDAPDLADARRQACGAEAQAERLGRLASDLLDLSRVDAGIPVRREPVNVGEVARSVVAEFALRAGEADRALALDAPDQVWASGDPGAVAQVIRILVDNAFSHGPERGGEIAVAVASRGDGAVEVTVADDGPGIAPEDRERVFLRFERASHATPGFGLGLAIGRELAHRMDGDLTLAPADGRTVFRLTVPAAPTP